MNPEQGPRQENNKEQVASFKEVIDRMPEEKAKKARALQGNIDKIFKERHLDTYEDFSAFIHDLKRKAVGDSAIIDEDRIRQIDNVGLFHSLAGSTQKAESLMAWPIDIIIEEDGTIRPAELDEVGEYEKFINNQESKLGEESSQ